MSENWVVQNLESALETWNTKLSEIWTLITQSPQSFKGGAIWSIVLNIHGALQAIGYALLVLFFVMGVMKTCGSFAELFDRMVKAEPFAYFFVSFGIACQMIIDGRVLYGQSAAAGEIGHTVVQRNGPVCPTCGNRGCLEALTGERAILQQCRDIMATDTPTVLKELCRDAGKLTMDQVLEAQKLGDKAVSHVIEDAIEYLGIALANTINLISPRSVVLEGRILSTPRNQERMLRIVDQYMFHIHSGMTDFRFLPYDPDRGARAAAAVVVKEFLGRIL